VINPFKRAAALAEREAAELRANPHLADVEPAELLRAAEVERLSAIAHRSRRVRDAQDHAAELARRAEALDQAVVDHAATAKAETARLAKMEATLVGSRDTLAAASRAAVETLARLQRAASAHDQLVAQSARELLAAGLPVRYVDGDVVHDFAVGATREETLRVGGRWWVRIDPMAVVQRAVYGVARAYSGEHVGLAERLRRDHGVRQLEDQSDGLLAGAPLPEPFVPPRDTSMDEARAAQAGWFKGAEVVSQPRRDPIDERREAYEAQQADRVARRNYAEARAQLVEEKGEERVRQLEAELFHDGKPFADEAPAGVFG
jgi:hypothetical protein